MKDQRRFFGLSPWEQIQLREELKARQEFIYRLWYVIFALVGMCIVLTVLLISAPECEGAEVENMVLHIEMQTIRDAIKMKDAPTRGD